LLSEGTVTLETLVCKEGMDTWIKLSNTHLIQTTFTVQNDLPKVPYSDKERILAGILQLIIPGTGRLYLGYTKVGLWQASANILYFFSCLIFPFLFAVALHIWSIVDGIKMLTKQLDRDAQGRLLR